MTDPLAGLPDFMEGHMLVAFYRNAPAETRQAALSALTDEEFNLQQKLDEQNESGGDYPTDDVVVVIAPEQADGVTSIHHIDEDGTAWHRPVLDIDFGAALIPSGTPGHFHLYLDQLMKWDDYAGLLSSLADAGIIEYGYDTACQERGYSSARLPSKPKVS